MAHRVFLQEQNDDFDTTYINASHICPEFITCQAPPPAAFADFWRMIWEQDVPLIFMLTQCVEKGKIKANPYWPKQHCSVVYGDITVECTYDRDERFGMIRREFTLMKGDDNFKCVTQIHYEHWADHGTPTVEELLHVVEMYRCLRKPGRKTVVHCSAGCGRAGTFVTTVRLLDYNGEFREVAAYCDDVPIHGAVKDIRMKRPESIQTADQYKLIYEAVNRD
jgi:protein tyrosine phosphatase